MSSHPVLFVCLGNICRSPLAEGIFRHLSEEAGVAERFPTDSAGMGSWHAGDPPDRRSIAMARNQGIDISAQRARQVTRDDFDRFELILAMDHSVALALRQMAPESATDRVHHFSEFALDKNADIPDPYYGGPEDFEQVYRMLFSGNISLLEKLGVKYRS